MFLVWVTSSLNEETKIFLAFVIEMTLDWEGISNARDLVSIVGFEEIFKTKMFLVEQQFNEETKIRPCIRDRVCLDWEGFQILKILLDLKKSSRWKCSRFQQQVHSMRRPKSALAFVIKMSLDWEGVLNGQDLVCIAHLDEDTFMTTMFLAWATSEKTKIFSSVYSQGLKVLPSTMGSVVHVARRQAQHVFTHAATGLRWGISNSNSQGQNRTPEELDGSRRHPRSSLRKDTLSGV